MTAAKEVFSQQLEISQRLDEASHARGERGRGCRSPLACDYFVWPPATTYTFFKKINILAVPMA